MNLMHIGELARRTRLSVKTVRYYSDLGLVPEAARTESGYRRYDANAVIRLEFVRTLRELGLDLATVRRVLDREADLSEVAAAHADAIGTQIRLLRVQRVALRLLARRHHTPEEVDRMNRLAQANADDRRRLINDFLDSIFEGVNVTPEFEAGMRRGMPELPDEPTEEQIDAWIELAELVRDEDFRERLRAMGRRSFGTTDSAQPPAKVVPTGPEAKTLAAAVATKAMTTVDPAASQADAVHDELVGAFAESVGRTPDRQYREELVATIGGANDPKAERYWQLIAVINGWPAFPSTAEAWNWFHAALAARLV